MISSALNNRRFTLYASALALGALFSQLIWMGHVWDSLAIRELASTWPEPRHSESLVTAIGVVEDGVVYSTLGFILAMSGLVCWSVAQWRKEPVWRSLPLALLAAYLVSLAFKV